MDRLRLMVLLAACAGLESPATAPHQSNDYDVLIINGVVYDGSGGPARQLDVAIRRDRVAALLEPGTSAGATQIVDADGRAVAPGFINVLSWATESLIADPRGMSDTKQGVTLEIFGEGWSMGPLNDSMKAELVDRQADIKYDIEWTTLAEYLEYLASRGTTPNVASFVGATSVRMHELGEEDRAPTAGELERMQNLVRQAMREGALGVGASLIYAPAFYADTEELIALAQAAGEFGGGYIAHMRSEANRLLEAVDETIRIAREAGVRAEIYHLKAAGEGNWPKMQQAIDRIEAARAEGLPVSADMYAYTAGATGLDAAMPPWVQEGGHDAWVERLQDPGSRARVIEEIKTPTDEWENLYQLAGSPDRLLFIGFKNEDLKPLTGRTLAEVAAERGTSHEETMIDLVIEDDSRVGTAYFLMSEENVELGLSQPWVSLGSDAESSAPEGVFLGSSTHPRAYGNFARFLGHYVRDRQLVPLTEAIRRITRLPAENWNLEDRGCLDPGCYADVLIFDPQTIGDHATYEDPRRYATGVDHVFINGVQVLRDGEHTGATPGRVVRGPGWSGGFTDWAREHAVALPAQGHTADADTFDRLEAALGSARVVALGEHAHGVHEPLALRNHLLEVLVERMDFTAIALESGFTESRRINEFILGGPDEAEDVVRSGLTWGFGSYAENLELIRWLRHVNETRPAGDRIRFYGIDVSGGVQGTLPNARVALDGALTYLRDTAADGAESIRTAFEPFLTSFSTEGYLSLTAGQRRVLDSAIDDLIATFDSERDSLVAASSPEAYAWAHQSAVVARQIAGMLRVWPEEMPENGISAELYGSLVARDRAMADNLLWALDREGPSGRILLFAHNAHVANHRLRGGPWSVFEQPPAMMGEHLRQALADDLVIAITSSADGGRDLDVEAARPGSFDAALADVDDTDFFLDLRPARPQTPAAQWLAREQSLRANLQLEILLTPRDAFDVVAFFQRTTPAGQLESTAAEEPKRTDGDDGRTSSR